MSRAYSTKPLCTLCRVGSVVFWVCSDGALLILRCDECDACFQSPDDLKSRRPLLLSAPRWLVPGTSVSINGKRARNARREEIESRGWAAFIAGMWEEP
jgi:hypothetical protein